MKSLPVLLLLASFHVGLVNPGFSAQVVHTFTGGTEPITSFCPASIPWVSFPLSVPKFDGQLGTLTKITIELTTTLTSSGGFAIVDDAEVETHFSPILSSYVNIPTRQRAHYFTGYHTFIDTISPSNSVSFNDFYSSGVQTLEVEDSGELDSYVGEGDATHTVEFAGCYYLAEVMSYQFSGAATSEQSYTYTVTYDYEP